MYACSFCLDVPHTHTLSEHVDDKERLNALCSLMDSLIRNCKHFLYLLRFVVSWCSCSCRSTVGQQMESHQVELFWVLILYLLIILPRLCTCYSSLSLVWSKEKKCLLSVLVHFRLLRWLITNKPRVVNIKSQELTGSSFIGHFLKPILHHQRVISPQGKIKMKFISVTDSMWWCAYRRLKSLLFSFLWSQQLTQRETVGHVWQFRPQRGFISYKQWRKGGDGREKWGISNWRVIRGMLPQSAVWWCRMVKL